MSENEPQSQSHGMANALEYAGFILLAFELVKGAIVRPVKAFYENTVFAPGMAFKSYEEDVKPRHKNEFEACLLYLRDSMEAIDSEDVFSIQALSKHRNELAHGLPSMVQSLEAKHYMPLLEKVDRALFKLSRYRAYMEIGPDPEFSRHDIDWDAVKGHEYLLIEEVLQNVRALWFSPGMKRHNKAKQAGTRKRGPLLATL